jgi:hypothetical protein
MAIFTTELATPKTNFGNQAGAILISGTFDAVASTMIAEIDVAATVIGDGPMLLTWHRGIHPTTPGARISKDWVNPDPPPAQGPLPGVTSYDEDIFVAGIDSEQVAGSCRVHKVLTGLSVGATYTFEIKWGWVTAGKQLNTGQLLPLGIAADPLGIKGVMCNFSSGSVSIFAVGATPWYRRAPGVYNFVKTFTDKLGVGYDNHGGHYPKVLQTLALAGAWGCDVYHGNDALGNGRAVVTSFGAKTVHLVNLNTQAIIQSSAALTPNLTQIKYFPNDATRAVAAGTNGHLYVMSISDGAAPAVVTDIDTGWPNSISALCTNHYSGTSVGIWTGKDNGTGDSRLYGRSSGGAAINGAAGLQLELGTSYVKCVRRVKTDDTLLVGLSNGKVFHVAKDGSSVLGSFTPPNAGGVGCVFHPTSDGKLVYVLTGVIPTSLSYFWLPAGDGPAYELFDETGVIGGAVTATDIFVTTHEYVLSCLIDTAASYTGILLENPGGYGTCDPTNAISAEHARVTVHT